MNIISYIGRFFSAEIKRLQDENKGLKGKLAHARRQADPVHEVNARHIASLQAKLHEHRAAYAGLRSLLADVHDSKVKGTALNLKAVTRILAMQREIELLMEGMEAAWAVIANAGGSNWTTQTEAWQKAASRWRDESWHAALARNVQTPWLLPPSKGT